MTTGKGNGKRRPTEEQFRSAIAILRDRRGTRAASHSCEAVADFLERDMARAAFDADVARYSRERGVSLAMARNLLKQKAAK